MKKLLTVVMAGLLLAAFALPAFAWEFSMTGEYDFRYRYFSRIGDRDLFGLMPAQDLSQGVATQAYTYYPVAYAGNPLAGQGNQAFTVPGNNKVGFAGPNFYGSGQIVPANAAGAGGAYNGPGYGTIISRGGHSDTGSDAQYADQRLTLVPTIRVNPAIRVHGTYNIGGIRNRFNQTNSGAGIAPFERYGEISTVTGSTDTWGIGSWEQVRATVTVPWGILSYGMKDFPFGLGTFTSYRTRGSAFVAVIPYGPFRFIPAFWHGHSSVNAADTENYRADGTNKSTWFGGFLFTYESGTLSAGGGWVGKVYHTNKALLAPAYVTNPTLTPSAANGADNVLNLWSWLFKYNNGRLFANATYEWFNSDTHYLLPAGAAGAQRPGAFAEAYHLFAEIGVMAGPSKLAAIWAQSSGPVRNDYSANDANRAGGGTGINPKTYSTWAIDFQVLDPYQYLMFGVYAGGNQTFSGLFLNDDGKGMMSDAYAFAGRLDYAVAANLNVWGSYMWAHRLERAGTYLGQYYSDGRDTMAANFAASTSTSTAQLLNFDPANVDPLSRGAGNTTGLTQRTNFRDNIGFNSAQGRGEGFVTDGYLGWEINIGCDWKLLEHMTMRTRYAYWQPGPWFQWAYQAITPVAGGTATTANGYLGTRDAIQAFEGSFVIDF